MNDDDDPNHSKSIGLPSTYMEQQNDQKMISSIDQTFSKEEEGSTSNRRRVRVKFAYSFDHDQVLPSTQTTVVKTEPCFKVVAMEDHTTKQFYLNKAKNREKTPLIKQETSIEVDSLNDDDETSHFNKEKEIIPKVPDMKQSVSYRVRSSIPLKPILKKPKKKEEDEKTAVLIIDQSLKSRFPSRKKKETPSTRLDFNEVQHLAEISAKQTLTSPSVHSRSLFDQTINIFDPDRSYRVTSDSPRPSRLQYYIKPYRGEPTAPVSIAKERSRSLPQQSGRTPRPFTKQSYRKQHVSWSPVRNYISQGREHTIITPTRPERTSSGTMIYSTLLPKNPPFQNLPPIIPVPIRQRLSQFSSSPPSSTDSYYTPTIIDRPLVSPTSETQYREKIEGKETMQRAHSYDQHKKAHDETMKRYDRVLEKIRATDEQLQSLSRSWINSTRQRTPVAVDRRSNCTLNKMTRTNDSFSPMTVQICLIILVIFNLLVVYFFNEINVWWSENIAPGMITE